MQNVLTVVHFFDVRVAQFFLSIRTPFLTVLFRLITLLGNTQFIGVLLIAIAIWVLHKRKYRDFVALSISVGIAETVTYLGKILFHRARPLHALITETDYSFPSGHATIAVAFYGFIAYMMLKRYISKKAKIVIRIVAIAVILFIGISRLYLGVHYFSDIIAGYIVGTIGLLIGISFVKDATQVAE